MKEIDYYKNNEILENSYYQIPQELFINKLYKEKLNSDSKILYAFLLDRLSLSQKNHWFDELNRVYLIFTRGEVQEKLCLSEKTVTKAFKQLTDTNLIVEKRQGLGKPNLIYVGKIQQEEIITNIKQENLQVLNSKNYGSREVKNTILDAEKFPTINPNNIKTNIINTDSINPKSNEKCIALMDIKEKSKLNEFTKEEQSILEDVIERLYYADNLNVGSIMITNSKILSKLPLINKNNLIQLLDISKNSNNVKNMTNYLMICLYNNLGNSNIKLQNKTAVFTREYERKYPNGFFDSLYANFASKNAIATS
jgi:replication initiator A domain protein